MNKEDKPHAKSSQVTVAIIGAVTTIIVTIIGLVGNFFLQERALRVKETQEARSVTLTVGSASTKISAATVELSPTLSPFVFPSPTLTVTALPIRANTLTNIPPTYTTTPVPISTTPAPSLNTPLPPLATLTPSTTPAPTIFTSPVVSIGVVYLGTNYIHQDSVYQRLRRLHFQVDYVNVANNQNIRLLDRFNVLIFPAGWGVVINTLNQKTDLVTSFLSNSGGIILEAPHGENRFTTKFLPYQIEFISKDSGEPLDKPPVIIDPPPSFLNGYEPSDFQVPHDKVNLTSDRYRLLVTGPLGTPYLAVSEDAANRIMFLNGTISDSMVNYVLPDSVVRSIVGWAMGK